MNLIKLCFMLAFASSFLLSIILTILLIVYWKDIDYAEQFNAILLIGIMTFTSIFTGKQLYEFYKDNKR